MLVVKCMFVYIRRDIRAVTVHLLQREPGFVNIIYNIYNFFLSFIFLDFENVPNRGIPVPLHP